MIGYLINRADPETGIVSDISYRELASMLSIDPAPGRRGAGTPHKQAIRSYLITISEQCSKDFKILSQGQSLQVQFLTLPEIYQAHFSQDKVYTDKHAVLIKDKSVETPHETVVLDTCPDTVSNTEVYTAASSESYVKNIYKTNNNNNKTNEKLLIADDFTPSPETIARATSMGIHFAEDLNEIQAFIDHNKAAGSLWADFNPIYLRWLARSAERKQQPSNQPKEIKHARSSGKTHKPSARERVINAYKASFNLCEETGRFQARAEHENEYDSHLMASAY
tara:strand:- start:3168 stop:4007 length:840 start_codon:yes stop_codon:yes gene_type:complete